MNNKLNYCTKNGIDFDVNFVENNNVEVVAWITNEENYLLTKEDLREMGLTARVKGVNKVWLRTNYGLEIKSVRENAKTVGFDAIFKHHRVYH